MKVKAVRRFKRKVRALYVQWAALLRELCVLRQRANRPSAATKK